LRDFFYSLVEVNMLNKTDTIVQMAATTFDAHILEIFGALFNGGTSIMLHPDGNMDFIYLINTLQNKQVTYMLVVPTFLNDLCVFINDNNFSPLSSIRSLCCGG
jgi:non-ribosomal peptide synthetase component F